MLTSPLIWMFGVVGLLLCVSAAVNAFGLMRQYELTATVQRMQVQKEEGGANQAIRKTREITDEQKNAVNSAIAQLNLPWRDLLDALEAATTANVALLSIDPDSKKQVVKGTAETKTSSEMISYIERLKRQSFFSSVVLTKHEINDRDANRPYRFQFEVHWTTDGGLRQ